MLNSGPRQGGAEDGEINNRILLVEDNPGDTRLLQLYLEDAPEPQFDLVSATRLEEALKLLREQKFDVVLLDLSLPDSHGLETFEQVNQRFPDVPVVVLSGLDDDALALSAVQRGAQDYLVKGQVNTMLLVRSIRYAVERHRMQVQLRAMSLVDELTGLYNRRGFLTLAEQQLKTSQRSGIEMVMFFADLDGMKGINDTYGHHEGDWALIQTAEVLRQTFRESDIIARLGGDEFTVLAIMKMDDSIEGVTQRLHDHVQYLNEKKLRPFAVRISIGYASCDPNAIHSIDELMAEADKVLYEQKRKKRETASG